MARTCSECGATIPKDAEECPKCHAKNEEPKIKYVAKPTILTDEFLAEQVWDRKDNPKFIMYHFNKDSFEEIHEIDLGEEDRTGRSIIYIPVDNEALRKGLVLVPTGITETTFKNLMEEADRFALKCYDPCGQDVMVRLLTRVVNGSWFLDRFVANPIYDIAGAGKFAPIIPIRGPSQSGKNRLAFVLRLLSYRPYFEMSTYRIPSLYRPLDVWQGTLVLDEADFAHTSERSELIHYLNCRATGTPVSRQDSRNPKLTHTFANFGITILTQRKQFDDNATESRCLPYYSEVTEKQLATVETDEMMKEGLELQNKLLYLRMKFFKKVEIEKDAWIGDLTDYRLIASLLPLLALSKHEPSIYETIVKTGKQIERLKVEEKASSEDGVIVNIFWEKIQNGLYELWNNPIYYVLESEEVIGEKERERIIKEALTTSILAANLKWSTRRVRKVIRGLNLRRPGLSNVVKVSGKSSRVIFFESDKLEKRLREFIVNYKPKELFEKLKVTEVTQVTHYLHGGVQNPELTTETPPCIGSVTSVTCVTDHDPDFLWRKIKPSEPCELCGKHPVEVEINDIHGKQILRRCPSCFESMQKAFGKAVWKEVD